MKPGDKVAGGTVVKVTDDGVYLGREAEKGEAKPDRHDEHVFGERRVFLSHDQGPVHPSSALVKQAKEKEGK